MIRKHNRLSFHHHSTASIASISCRLSMYVLSPGLIKLVRQPTISLLSRVVYDYLEMRVYVYLYININIRSSIFLSRIWYQNESSSSFFFLD